MGSEKATGRLEQGTHMIEAGATQSGVHGSVPSVSSLLQVGDKTSTEIKNKHLELVIEIFLSLKCNFILVESNNRSHVFCMSF